MWVSEKVIQLQHSVACWLSCLLLNTRFVGWNLAKDDGFLTAIKIRSTTSFGGEVKLAVPCRKIIRHVEEPYKCDKRYLVGKIRCHLSPRSSCFAVMCVCW
jgi:hypothetical protein